MSLSRGWHEPLASQGEPLGGWHAPLASQGELSAIQDKAQLSSSSGLDIAEKSDKKVFEFVHNLMFFLQTDALSWRLRGSCRSLGGLPGYNGSEAGTLNQGGHLHCMSCNLG